MRAHFTEPRVRGWRWRNSVLTKMKSYIPKRRPPCSYWRFAIRLTPTASHSTIRAIYCEVSHEKMHILTNGVGTEREWLYKIKIRMKLTADGEKMQAPFSRIFSLISKRMWNICFVFSFQVKRGSLLLLHILYKLLQVRNNHEMKFCFSFSATLWTANMLWGLVMGFNIFLWMTGSHDFWKTRKTKMKMTFADFPTKMKNWGRPNFANCLLNSEKTFMWNHNSFIYYYLKPFMGQRATFAPKELINYPRGKNQVWAPGWQKVSWKNCDYGVMVIAILFFTKKITNYVVKQ